MQAILLILKKGMLNMLNMCTGIISVITSERPMMAQTITFAEQGLVIRLLLFIFYCHTDQDMNGLK